MNDKWLHLKKFLLGIEVKSFPFKVAIALFVSFILVLFLPKKKRWEALFKIENTVSSSVSHIENCGGLEINVTYFISKKAQNQPTSNS